jgi:integrase
MPEQTIDTSSTPPGADPVETPRSKRQTRRRGRGEGSLHYRKGYTRKSTGKWVPPCWCGCITTGQDANGKQIRRSVYGSTKADVQQKLMRLQAESLNGWAAQTERMTVGQWLQRWLTDATALRPRTTDQYRRIIKNKIVPHIGGTSLPKLSPVQIQGLYATLKREGASDRMRQLTHAVLHRALRQALQLGLVTRNAYASVQRPGYRAKTMQTLDKDQVSQLLKAAAGDRLEALYVLAVMTGLRQGELLGLKWSDIDLQKRVLSVRRTLYELNGKIETGEPKTDKGRRQVDLPVLAVSALQRHRAAMMVEGHRAAVYVFCDSEGNPLRKSNLINRSFRPLLTAAKLPRIRFHDLRHTAATLLLLAGENPKVVQERLGHATISITLDTYSHVLPTMQREAADKLDRLFQVG